MPKGVKYGRWASGDMERALAAVRNGDIGLNAAAREYSIPKATLKRHLDGKNYYATEGNKVVGSLGDIPPHVEEELVRHVLDLEKALFGITATDLRRLAFQVAEANNIPHRFHKDKQIAGKKWYYLFMRRHPELSLRQPEATSMARATGFNKGRVHEFFNILERLVVDNNINATNIFNVDETGLTIIQKKPRKIISRKGKAQVGAISSGERGLNTTAVCCVSAAGFYVPPMLIYKRGRACEDFKDGAPPGTVFVFNAESSYINKEIFVQWLQHFIKFVKPNINQKVLLLLDGHSTHTKNIDALQIARENGIIMLSLPGHTTHRLQPLDVAFFKPLNTYYSDDIEKWLRANPGRCITQAKVAMLFGTAYGRAASVSTAVNAFRATGIWPVNRDVFQEHHFAPSLATTPGADALTLPHREPNVEVDVSISMNTQASTSGLQAFPVQTEDEEGTTISSTNSKPTSSSLAVPLEKISPLPKAAAVICGKRKQTGTQRATVLTSSPYKYELENAAEKRALKQNRGRLKPKKLKMQESGESNSWFCELCETACEDDMIQCLACKKWVHENCAGVKKGQKRFFCFNCH